MTGNPMKCQIQALDNGTTRVEVYDDIGPGGWFSEGLTAKDFAAQLAGVKGPLDVHINSAGGDVGDGIAIKNAISSYPGKKRTVVDGLAASVASVIAQAGDERIVEPGAMLMVHDPFTGIVGNAAELRKTADTLDKHGDNLAQIYASRAGGTSEQWRGIMQQEAWYTADEAVEHGLADRVGMSAAKLPAGVDIDALAAHAPTRIMAALRSMPVARPAAAAGDGADDGGSGDGPPQCKTCKGKGRLKHPGTGKNGMTCPGCNGKGVYDPDNDGDDDSTAEGDTDHDYVLPDGSPGPKAAPAALDEDRVRAIIREEVARAAAAKVDESSWDGSKAMAGGAAADDPAAFYEGICAGKKDGNPRNQDSWALPYRYKPGGPPNAAGVKNALARLPQTQGLTNEAEAKKTLQAAMKLVNPDWEPEDSTGTSISAADAVERYRAALKGAQ